MADILESNENHDMVSSVNGDASKTCDEFIEDSVPLLQKVTTFLIFFFPSLYIQNSFEMIGDNHAYC